MKLVPRTIRRRNRTLVILFLPALIFMGILGWLMVSFEKLRKAPIKTHKSDRQKTHGDDGVTFIPAVFEEQQESPRE